MKEALSSLATAAAQATAAEGAIAADPRALSHVASINVAPSINGMLDAIMQNTPFQPSRVAAVTEALSTPDGVKLLSAQMGSQVATALRKVAGGADRKRKETQA